MTTASTVYVDPSAVRGGLNSNRYWKPHVGTLTLQDEQRTHSYAGETK